MEINQSNNVKPKMRGQVKKWYELVRDTKAKGHKTRPWFICMNFSLSIQRELGFS
jgi:hypothetical protein